MISYGDLALKVARLLSDPDNSTYSEELIWDGVVSALDAVMPYIPQFAFDTLTAGSGGDVFQLPDDLYAIQAVRVKESGVYLPKATMAPSSVKSSAEEDNDWLDYPTGYLSLSVALDEGDELELFYFSYWPKPATETDLTFQITVPDVAYEGLMLYAASHCLMSRAVSAANIRQFNLREDSGNPEHNPIKEMGEAYRHLFYQEMKTMPPYTRVGL